ncbi:autotransporter domain-containing protein [Fusobacterium nucleatum]|uniref:autotransporter domain-containing protein n=1 Tax=Fusobacterium vincentii TaxID=155615 RepID=UPI000410C62A|nr:autotransporter domain-containing protein [Fusobacterium vincentii]ALF20156.1 autotransporter [Fusobacterium vincentii ChDC F8]
MKKVIWKIVLLLCLTSFSLYGVQWNDLKDGETAEKILDENGKETKVDKIVLGKNSHLKVKGKNTKGIVIKYGIRSKVDIGEGATLDVDIESSIKEATGIASESYKDFIVQKNGNLKVKNHFIGTINSGDIFKQFLDNKKENSVLKGISVLKRFSTEGNTRIESSGTGIGFDKKTSKETGLIEFKKGSKTFVKAGFAGVFARYNSVTFEEGSDTTLIGGAYGIMVNKGTIKKGSKVTLMGNYGTGKFEVKEHDFLKFESGSELNILANDSALYGIRLKGKTKLIAKGYNVLRQIDTYADGEHSLDTVTFEKGSILDGNIDRSWNSQFLLEEGTKLFVPNKIQANLEIKGDLYVGPRAAYEGKQLTYKEAVEDADTVAGATALFMGKQAQRARKGEFTYRGLYSDFAADEYYTLDYNKHNYSDNNHNSTLNLNNGKIHLRLGTPDRLGRINDKIIFSKNTVINGKGELVFHKRNSSQVTKNTVFKILEEEGLKNINGTQGYYLEKLPLKIPDVSFGQLVFTTKVQKLNGRYVVSLVFKGIEADNFLLAKGETKTLNKKKEGSLEDAILSAKEVTIEEKSTLNIKGDTNGLFAKNKVTVEEKANLNIETENKIALKLGENLETFGNINIKNAGTGILADNTASVLKFENGSKTIVNAKDVAVNAQKGTSEFKGGSNVELTSNKYALVAKKAVFEKGSTVKLNAEYGIGTLSETDSSDVTFNSQSEVSINSSNSGIYNVNVGGSGKLSIKAPNILKQVRTVNQSLKFESGSVLEGNIEKSWNANLILDKDSKMFVNNKIEANMDIKGDLFVGTRNSYEKEENKNSMQTLSTMSTFSSSNKYNTVHYNKDSNGHKTKVNLDNANIHLRINGEQSESNDKIVFSKDTEITGKGEITLHPENVSKVRRNMTYSLLEEEGKDVGGNKVYNLEKTSLTLKTVEFGPLVYGRKDKKVNGKYIVTLEDTGELSQAAKNTLTSSRDSYKYNQEELKAISDKIFENHNLELKNNFWLLVSKENLKNKDSVIKLNQNTKYAGYDYTFNTGISLGFFAGQSTGRYKNIGQGIYLKKDLKPFYLGTVYKHTKSKDKNNDKKLHSNDFSFVVGYNKDISEKTFLDSNIKLTRGYISDYKYTAENDLSTKNEKTDYWNGEIDAKLGYKFKYGNAFLKAGLDKDLKGNQKVIWNENIDEEIKYDDLSKNIGIGMEYKIKQHSFNIELSRKYSKHYRANTKISIGYSYKF